MPLGERPGTHLRAGPGTHLPAGVHTRLRTGPGTHLPAGVHTRLDDRRVAVVTRYVALLRGVNLGAHRTLDMADLRATLTGLGHTEVRTHLRSGNAVFTGPDAGPGPDGVPGPVGGSDAAEYPDAAEHPDAAEPAQRIARDLEERLANERGLRSAVVVRTAGELRATVEANPWEVDQPARFLVAFLTQPLDPEALRDLDPAAYAPERWASGPRELYLDLPDGIRNARLPSAVSRRLAPMTTRNWNTVLRLLELAENPGGKAGKAGTAGTAARRS